MATDNRAGAEALNSPVAGLVPIPKRLRTLPIRSVLANRADEQVPNRSRRYQSSGPDFPVYDDADYARRENSISDLGASPSITQRREQLILFDLPDFV